MKRFIVFFILFIVAAWLGVQIAQDPGYAFFAYRQWTVEMPLWLVITFMIILFFIVGLASRLIQTVRKLSMQFSHWCQTYRQRQSQQKTNKGLVQLAEGKWKLAEKLLVDALAESRQPLINYLAAARAAQEQKAYDRRDSYLQQAYGSIPGAEIAIGLVQAKLQINHQQLAHGLMTLRHLQAAAPGHHHVLNLLKVIYLESKDWHELKKLLPDLKRHHVISAQEAIQLSVNVYSNLLNSPKKPFDGTTLTDFWLNLPRELKREKSIVIAYANGLASIDCKNDAQLLLYDAIERQWDLDYIYRYGQLIGDNNVEQLNRAEHWLKQHGESAVLLLTLGRLAKSNQLWEKAKKYLVESLQIEARAETYYEYAELLERLGETPSALEQFKKGLQLSITLNQG